MLWAHEEPKKTGEATVIILDSHDSVIQSWFTAHICYCIFSKQDLKQRNIQVTMLKKGFVVSRLINWRIERDDALGTLFFTFVLLWLGGVRRRLHTWHPARFWFESEVEDCLVPVGAGTGLLVGCENEGCYMLLCWSLMHRSTLTSRVISKQKPLCVPGTQKLDL